MRHARLAGGRRHVRYTNTGTLTLYPCMQSSQVDACVLARVSTRTRGSIQRIARRVSLSLINDHSTVWTDNWNFIVRLHLYD
eukprot:COSAG02_NODE_15967_length_1124_cov_2.386341_1_plen_81_part_01